MITITEVLFRTRKSFYIKDNDYSTLKWNDDSPKPTLKELEDERDKLIAEYNAQEYQRKRVSAYPEIKEQLDLLYHDMTAGKGDKTGEWYKAVNKVKTDNPKPE